MAVSYLRIFLIVTSAATSTMTFKGLSTFRQFGSSTETSRKDVPWTPRRLALEVDFPDSYFLFLRLSLSPALSRPRTAMSASEVAHGSSWAWLGSGCSIAPAVKNVSELAKLQGLARGALGIRQSSPGELRHFSEYSPGLCRLDRWIAVQSFRVSHTNFKVKICWCMHAYQRRRFHAVQSIISKPAPGFLEHRALQRLLQKHLSSHPHCRSRHHQNSKR